MIELIKYIIKEESEKSVFSPLEIRLFKFVNKFKRELGTESKMLEFFRNSLSTFNLPTSESRKYYDTYTLNYRPDGDYENVTMSNFKDPKRFSQQKRTSNTLSSTYASDKIPFKGSNLEGKWKVGGDNEWVYVVTSYSWYPIYAFKFGKWFEVDYNYSSSTSKHMAHSRPTRYNNDLNEEMILVSREEMKKIIEGRITIEQLISGKEETFKSTLSKAELENKNLFITSGWGDSKIKITFKITSYDVIQNRASIDIVVTNVQKMQDRKVVKGEGEFFKGEMPNVGEDDVKESLEYQVGRGLSIPLGRRPVVDMNISFDYNPNIKQPLSFATFESRFLS
jgi:hypothetical protein